MINNSKNNLVELKSNKTLISIKETNKIVLTLIFLTANLSLSLLAILLLLVNNNKLIQKDKIFVQDSSGAIQAASEKDVNFRSDEVIKKFVTNWLYLTWELDSSIPNTEQQDIGVEIRYKGQNKFKVPSRVYAASFAIEQGFREEFLKKISELVPLEFYNGKFESELLIYNIGNPVRKEDTYQVQVTATRTDKNDSGELGRYKFNKTIILKPIEPYKLALGNDEKSHFRKYLNQFLSSGLIINSIHNHEY